VTDILYIVHKTEIPHREVLFINTRVKSAVS